MKKTFCVGLFDNGSIIPSLTPITAHLTFENNFLVLVIKTKFFTEFMRITIPYDDIENVQKAKKFLLFSCVVIKTKNNSKYEFTTPFNDNNLFIKLIEDKILKKYTIAS